MGVINTLMGLSKAAVTRGIQPPLIVKYEMEIDALEKEERKKKKNLGFVSDCELFYDNHENIEEQSFQPYQPSSGDAIDVALSNVINDNKLHIPFRRGSTGIYHLPGSRKNIHIRLIRKTVLIRVGGGWMDVVSFANRKFTIRLPLKDRPKKDVTEEERKAIRDEKERQKAIEKEKEERRQKREEEDRQKQQEKKE